MSAGISALFLLVFPGGFRISAGRANDRMGCTTCSEIGENLQAHADRKKL